MRTWQRLTAAGVFLSVTGLGVAAAAAPGWTTVRSVNAGPNENELLTVTALSKTNAWAFGAYYKHPDWGGTTWLAAHWDGQRWSQATLPTARCGLAGISDSSAGSARNIWLLGYGNGWSDDLPCLLHYHSGTWSQAPLIGLEVDLPMSWADIAAAPGNRAWLAGAQLIYGVGAVPTIAKFNGSYWQVTNVPLASGLEGSFTGLARIPRTSQWVAIGETDNVGSDPSQGALVARFDGTSWSVQDVPDPAGVELKDVLPLSPTNIWAVGYRSGAELGEISPVVAHYTASGWRFLPVNPKLHGLLLGVAAHGPHDVVMVGRTGYQTVDAVPGERTLVLRWNGSRIYRQPSPNPATGETNRLADVASIPGTRQFWAVGGSGAYGRTLTARTLAARGR